MHKYYQKEVEKKVIKKKRGAFAVLYILVCLRKSKFLSKTLLTLDKYRCLSRIKRVLDKSLDLRKHKNMCKTANAPRFFLIIFFSTFFQEDSCMLCDL